MTSASGDPYAHLRANAAAQKQTTVDRLRQAITQLEAEGRPINTFTIREVSGMDYMAYYRNREAFQLFQEHSTHLRKEREQEQAKQKTASRSRSRKQRKDQAATHVVKVSPRDPLLDYKRSRLVELVHEARSSGRRVSCLPGSLPIRAPTGGIQLKAARNMHLIKTPRHMMRRFGYTLELSKKSKAQKLENDGLS